jgi:DNA-binding winged helix-turn-helix (wHTH) protein
MMAAERGTLPMTGSRPQLLSLGCSRGKMDGVTMRYIFGDYSLDTLRYELSRAGVLIPLRPKVFQVLAYLITQRDRVVLKQELLDHLWPAQYVGDAALNSYVMAVRQALGDNGQRQQVIRTVRGRGYRFVVPVEEQESTPWAEPPQGRGLAVERAPVREPTSLSTIPAADTPWADAPPTDGEYKLVTVLCCALAGASSLMARPGTGGSVSPHAGGIRASPGGPAGV